MAEEAAAQQQEAKDEMSEFDVIVLGTGLKECILSGLLSTSGKKVLHLDRNAYYGGESASLNLDQLFEKFEQGAAPEALGRAYDYCVDLSPKFLMACGDLVKILVKTKVADYLDFAGVSGSFVLQKGKIQKVPSTTKEAFSSSMLGLLEKNYFRKFLTFVASYDAADPKTHGGYKLAGMTALTLYKKFGLSENAQQFTGHAIALYLDDSYLEAPNSAVDLIKRSQLYAWSVARYGSSPYLYPKYGLGGLPEGFSRRCAVHGGTFMLNMNKAHPFVESINYGDDGKVTGITLGEEVVKQYDLPNQTIKCAQLVGDPSYFAGTPKIEKVGEIARCIAVMSHPIPGTGEVDSCQLILPAKQCGRKSDIYVCMTSSAQKTAAAGKYVCVMSCNIEGKSPEDELAPALALLGKIDKQFVWSTEVFQSTADGSADNVFIPASVDPTTHFSTSTADVLALYERINGEAFDLTPEPKAEEGKE